MIDNYEQEMILPDFDRELALEDLLAGIDPVMLESSFNTILGTQFSLTDNHGVVLLGESVATPAQTLVIAPELEPVGILSVSTNAGDKTQACVSLLLILLRSSSRYLMASNLHLQAVKEDFNKLQKKHEDLMTSENRYRELSTQLEQRVYKQVEVIEESQRQLYQAEKMASVGQLAAGVAHEINNPIGFISSNLNTAASYVADLTKFSKKLKQSEENEEILSAWQENDLDFVMDDFTVLLNESISGAERVTKIVADLKAFSNVDRAEEEVVDLNEVIRGTCNVASNKLGKINLKLEFGELKPIICQRGHIGDVLMNTLLNAIKAVDEADGEIIISSLLGNDRIVVTMSDNGKGIPADIINRVFDPFYTSHDVGQGTGLGMTVSRDIIKAHDGDISIESEQGKGTTVSWWIPLAKQ